MPILILFALFFWSHFRELADGYRLAFQVPEVGALFIVALLTLLIIVAISALVDAVVGYAAGNDD